MAGENNIKDIKSWTDQVCFYATACRREDLSAEHVSDRKAHFRNGL